MKFWFVHSGDVSLHDQIVTQVSLGILSGDLSAGERLPSIRALAQRFGIHANTVSAGYRELERECWVEFRHGSGVYVRDNTPKESKGIRPALHLDGLIADLIQAARAAKLPNEALKARFLGQLNAEPPARLLLVESDTELRTIVLSELHAAIKLPQGMTIAFTEIPHVGDARAIEALMLLLPGSLAMVLPSKAETLRAMLPATVAMQVLKVRSIPQSLAPWLPAPGDTLVGVASRWPPFLEFAKTMLVAAGFEADALLLRDASQPGWMSGLDQARTVVCDAYTALLLPASIPSIRFDLLAKETVADLHEMLRAGLA